MSFHETVFGRDRLRAGWRALLFLALFFTLSALGTAILSFLPREARSWAFQGVLLAAALLASAILLLQLEDRPVGAVGLAWSPAALRESVLGTVIGGVLIAVASLLIFLTGGARFVPDAGGLEAYLESVFGTLLFFALAAAVEEILFRGYAFQVLVEGMGVWPAVVLSSLVFSVAHAGTPNVNLLGFTNIFLAGVLLAVAYLQTRSLWYATGIHLGWNWTMATLLDFPVSGWVYDTPLYSVVVTGEAWWTGGGYGPEAGLAGTLVLLAGTIWMLRFRPVRESEEMHELRPIVDRRLLAGRR